MLLRRYRASLDEVQRLRSAIRQKMAELAQQDATLADQESSLLALCNAEGTPGRPGGVAA